VVVGYLLLMLLGRNRLLGGWLHEQWGVDIAFTWWAAVLASAVMGFPLLVRAVRLAMELVDPELEHTATTLGASPIRVFFTITLPLSMPGIVTGLLLSFARSLGEFGATITFAGNIAGETRTLPLALFTLTQTDGAEGAALRLVALSIAISFSALLASEYFARRVREGRSSRAEL
jgi:molybdate transport system permease protein